MIVKIVARSLVLEGGVMQAFWGKNWHHIPRIWNFHDAQHQRGHYLRDGALSATSHQQEMAIKLPLSGPRVGQPLGSTTDCLFCHLLSQ